MENEDEETAGFKMTWTDYMFESLKFYAIDFNKNDELSIKMRKSFKEDLLKLTTMADEHNEKHERLRTEKKANTATRNVMSEKTGKTNNHEKENQKSA